MEHPSLSYFHSLDLNGQPLNLDITLTCGQAFRWQKHDGEIWRGVVRDKLIELKSCDGRLLWRTFPVDDEVLVRDYLRLDEDVASIYARLSSTDRYLAGLIRRFHGLRLLRQDPAETLFSFVCSTANSIHRIAAAIETVAAQYGELVCEHASACYYSFPSVEKLASASTVAGTKSLGFRGRNLQLVAQQLCSRGAYWLDSLRNKTYSEARRELMSLWGVGRKIADCVCLFALDKDEAVPVDTHVRQLVCRLWGFDINGKSLTNGLYDRIAAAFTERYGLLAGWAQQFLFYEDLLRSRKA